MKKLMISFLLLSGIVSNAQRRTGGDIELVPYIGYATSTLSGDYIDDLDYRNSADFGVVADYYFNNRWSLRSGLQFQSMGAENQYFVDKLSYLSIPVNANWHFGSNRKWNLNFGLTPSFLLSADENGQDISSYLNSFQMGLTYGIGYKIEVSKKFSILVDWQGFSGMSDITKKSGTVANAHSVFNVGGVFKL
ncbi:porin family protein [Flavobacterium stagni]|uniref:PorT family protein n=1 Tax=Flavobacterium stagni TaxID=2506421 RepID=A0A4Q1KCQ3_9FLAO|nr:porin family protein [Flavobacterium stagni]RXR24013.1 PorT family protein [Flavobacterium stagni]